MSDPELPTPPSPPVDASGTEPAPADAPAKNKKGKWFRGIRVLILLVLFLAMASRAVIIVLLPPVLRHVAGYYGVDASYERLELSVLGGDTSLWHLVIKPKDSAEPLAVIDYCRGDISPLNLLRGRLDVWRVEADGVHVSLDREADGSIPLLKLVAQNAPTAAKPTPNAQAKAAGKVDLVPPLRLDALRLSHIRLRIRDKAVTPQFDSTVSVDLRLSDLGGTSGRPTEFSADVDADPFLDALHVTGEGRTQAGAIDATFNANVNGLRLRPLAPYLAALGLRPMANETSLRAGGELKLGPAADNPNLATATLKVNHLMLLDDGEEAAALDQLTLEAPAVDPHRIGLRELKLDNVRLRGRRAANGNIRFAGLEYIGAPPATQPAAAPAPVLPPATAAPFILPIIDLPLIVVKSFSASFQDDAILPATNLAILVENLAVKKILLDPAHPDATVTINGLAHVLGIAENVRLDGSIQPMATTKTLSMSVSADQVSLGAIKPYLDQLGIVSTLHGATFNATASAELATPADGPAISGSLKNIKLSQGADLVSMDHISVMGARFSKGIQIDNISVAGPKLAVSREADGSLAAAGFNFNPKRIPASAKPPATVPIASAQPAVAPEIPALPTIVVKHFRWDGIDVSFDDRAMAPALHTQITDAGAEYDAGKIHAWLKAPKVVEALDLNGQIAAIPGGARTQLKFSTTGVDSSIVAPLLQPLHLEPTLRNGAVTATADLTVIAKDHSLAGSLNLSDIDYRDGDRELAGVDRLAIDSVTLTASALTLGKIQVDRPRATATREPGGTFAAAGFRVLPAMFAKHNADPTAPSAASTTQPAAAPIPLVVTLDGFRVNDGSLRFADQLANTDTTATATLDVQHVTLGKPSDPATFSLKAAVSGVIDQATIDGKLMLDPSAPGADMVIKADNLRAGQLAAYLPAGIAVPLKGGSFQTNLQASLAPAKAGGNSVQVVVTDLDFHDASQALAKVASARAIVSRIDPAASFLSIDELSTAGGELAVARTADGGIRALGIEVGGSSTAPVAPPSAARSFELAAPPATRPAASVQALVAASHKTLPTFVLDRLDAKVQRLTFTDEQRPASAPLVIRDLKLCNLGRVDWGGPDPDSKPVGKFQIDCEIDPFVGALTIGLATSPLAAQPTLSVDVLARGIRGDGLTDLVPELKPYLQGAALTRGEFHSRADATFRLSQRGLSQIDYLRPIDADLDIKPVTFRATEDGPILAGVDEVHSDGVHFEPKTGALHVKTLEITKATGRVSREADGIHVLGVVFQVPGATTQPSTQPAPELALASAKPPLATPTTAPAMRPVKPAAEIRVDQLVINGLDFVAEDKTVTPPLVIPLNQLDVEVRDFTNFAPYEDRPLKFTALVNADEVRLTKPLASSGIAGALGDAGALLGGKKVATKREYENRELFAEASANGSIGLYPAPNGYIKTSLGGLELQALGSLASTFGINLTNGIFDSTVDARLPGDGSIQTKSKFVVTDLSVSEPPNGPIFRYLHLPAPLDTVVGVLQDQEGSITVPLDVPVKNAQLSPAALAGPAIGAFGSIVTTAIASTPLKAAGAVTDLLGLGGKKETAPQPPIALAFEAGDVTLSRADLAAIVQLRTRLIKEPGLTLVIKHALGGGDVKTAESRANPSPQDAQYLAQRLREQQIASAQLRSQLAGVATSDIQRGAASDQTLARLKQVNQQMAQTDDAMDRLFDLLRPGSDRLAGRRTRSVCIAYGKQRLAVIQSALLEKATADVADRIHLLTPQFTTPADDAGGMVLVQLIPKKK